MAFLLAIGISGDTTGNQIGVDPMLGPLQDNGGRTFTHALLPSSPAIDAADNTDCPLTDQRGFSRPIDANNDGIAICDIGAYEVQVDSNLAVIKWANPNPVQAGAPLTYTIHITNTGVVTLTATITDTLPTYITQGETPGGSLILPGGVITWTPVSIVPGDVWTETVIVTVTMGYAGLLTNIVQVTTEEGATGIYTETSTAYTPQAALKVSKKAYPEQVQAGERLTYTLYVTNTGDLDLHATITDTIPAQVTPTGPITWTPIIIAPGSIWVGQLVVTTTADYSGTLTNVVNVSTEEGATGVYTVTTNCVMHQPALLITKRADPTLVQAGGRLTYTIHLTNIGNVDLHPTITDILPAQVTPTEKLTWTADIVAPGGIWAKQFVVTVEESYSGTLTNLVQVTTIEGVTDIYTETSRSQTPSSLSERT